MRKLTERQYEGFASLNRQMIRAIEWDGLGPKTKDLDDLKRDWKDYEKRLGKTCDRIACSVAGRNYHEYFSSLERLEAIRDQD